MIDPSSPEYEKHYNWFTADQTFRSGVAVANALTYDAVTALLAIACLIGGSIHGDEWQVGLAIGSLACSLFSLRLCERAIHKSDAGIQAYWFDDKPYPELPYKFLQALNYASGVLAIASALFFL